MTQTVAVMGFDQNLQRTLEGLLAREPDLTLADPSATQIDTIILFPPSVEWVHELRERYPRARFLAVVDWQRRHQFVDAPIHGYVDTLLSYHGLLEVVRESL